MPVPYTMEAVAALRHAERIGVPAQEVQAQLGWDGGMMMRVCRKHGIGLVDSEAASAAPQMQREPAGPIAPYPPEVMHIISNLTERQTEIFDILRRAANDGTQWVRGTDIAEMITGAGRRSICMSAASLARRLKHIDAGYQVETQKGMGGGYRLVISEALR